MSLISNLGKGVVKKFTAQKQHFFPPLSWASIKVLKHLDDIKEKQFSIGKVKLVYTRPYEIIHTYTELFQDEIYHFTTAESQPFIIDCGAHIGMSVVYFKLRYPNAKVIAFEPDKANRLLLEKNIALNKLSDVKVIPAAVWKENTTLRFSAVAGQGSKIDLHATNTIEVKAERLHNYLQQPIDFLKIDIEGAEDVVLADCQDQLHMVQNIFVEYHGTVHETSKLIGILALLEKAGFSVYIKMAADNLSQPYVNKVTGTAHDVQLNIFGYRK
ncbi:MAG: FkbM family methyltransferase [Chitinophagaceae bacterium]